MKIIKETEVKISKEDIIVESGIYYFDDTTSLFKVEFTEDEDNWIDYKIEKLHHYSNVKSLTKYQDYDDKLPWFAEQLWKEGAKRIEEMEYYEAREKLLKELI